MIETARDLPPDEQEAGRAVLARALSGKLGVAVVAASVGGVMAVAEFYEMGVPMVDDPVELLRLLVG